MKTNIVLLPALLFSLVLLFPAPRLIARAQTNVKAEIEALNQEINQRKDHIKQLEETIEQYNKTIVQKRTEAVSLKNQLSILDNRLAQLENDIDVTKEKIKQAELEIAALTLSISETEATVAKQKKLIAKMVHDINAASQKNYVEIFVSYDTFANFYNELRYLENVYSDLGRSVKTLRLLQEDLERQRATVERRRQTHASLKQELEQKKQNLAEQAGYKQNLLAETKNSEWRYRTLLASLKQQYQIIENDVRTYEARIRQKLAEQDRLQAGGDVLLTWPLETRTITTNFRDPEYPFRRVFEHSGLDLRAAPGTPIKAAGAGYVARARRCISASCYSYVLIIHTGSISTVYGHLSSIVVTDDAFVNRGDIIGYSGGTPGSVGAGPFVTGPHLHFEVRLNGIPVDPLGYLAQ